MGCLLAFAVYRKFVLAGASTQTILYVVALWGAERVIQADCALGNCTSQNKIIIALSAMLAGFQMMGMLAVTIMMWLGTWKKLRPEESL
jgi:hypothetical protein